MAVRRLLGDFLGIVQGWVLRVKTGVVLRKLQLGLKITCHEVGQESAYARVVGHQATARSILVRRPLVDKAHVRS